MFLSRCYRCQSKANPELALGKCAIDSWSPEGDARFYSHPGGYVALVTACAIIKIDIRAAGLDERVIAKQEDVQQYERGKSWCKDTPATREIC